jgi:hypothetical protein
MDRVVRTIEQVLQGSDGSVILLFTGTAPDTRNAPIHSVMLGRSKTGEWRIRHWHVSR